MSKIRVLIVDDSSVIRSLLNRILSSDPEIEVVGSAPDPFVAREKLVALRPDVMTLDIEMPRMDGITFLEKVMSHFPTRTLVISSLSTRGSETALRALEVGAIEVMAKPAIDVTRSMEGLAKEITQRVKTVARARIQTRKHLSVVSGGNGGLGQRKQEPGKSIAGSRLSLAKTTHQVLAIASSTGGTEALKEVLPYLPGDLPGTVIVQHMPPGFTKIYAESLSKICPFEVREACDGDRVVPGVVLIAPGNFHMEIERSGGYYVIKLHQQPHMHGVRPAADYLMKSVAKYAGANAIGLVLTGMGRDGAEGLAAMKEAGSFNIAQDEESCVVFGMPKAAIDRDAVHSVLPLDRIAKALIDQFQLRQVA